MYRLPDKTPADDKQVGGDHYKNLGIQHWTYVLANDIPYLEAQGTGVYCLKNLVNGKLYIGSAAVSINKRLWQHFRDLRANQHSNKFLQRSYNKHGPQSFAAAVVENCTPELCIKTEQKWLDRLKSYDQRVGYNLSPTAGSPLGYRMSKKSRLKISLALRGRKKTPEHVANAARGQIGKTRSLESRLKQSKTLTGRKLTKTHVANISKSLKGKRHSKEHAQALADSLKTDEVRARISAGVRKAIAEGRRTYERK